MKQSCETELDLDSSSSCCPWLVLPLAGQGGDRQEKGILMSLFTQPCAFPCLLLPVNYPVINYTTLQPPKIYLECYVCCCCHLHNGKCAVAANGSLKGITALELLWEQGRERERCQEGETDLF